MAAVANAPGIPTPSPQLTNYNTDNESMSTIPDPRSRTRSLTNAGESPEGFPHHPDLSSEVATLSNKLINAINHQTNLDDTLSVTRHELEASRERIRQLELETEEYGDQISRGILIRSTIVQAERKKLLSSLAEEKMQRAKVEKDKKRIEQELENLTTALFEEANKMVKTAREEASKDHEIIQRKNDQLKSQLADMETLLKSHQEQLAELKQVMEQMSTERDDQSNLTAPSTPGLSKFDGKDEIGGDATSDEAHSASSSNDVLPSHPTSFTHILHPVLRTDLNSYDDFTSLLRMSKKFGAGSRVSSGSNGSFGLNFSLGTSHQPANAPNQTPSNSSASSFSTPATTGSSPVTPVTPASSSSNNSINGPNVIAPLKETRFYKRSLVEDIEPTLRLDTAPGLSWLARRSVLNAMCEGTLVVEPVPPTSKKLYMFACSLCGETRRDPSHVRTHRFRTSEADSAQRYPLCKYCLSRMRSSCDFLGFLRLLKDGHWRTDDEESEHAAWEESVRLREQMFWSRIGGGVVPLGVSHHENCSKCSRSANGGSRGGLDTIQNSNEEVRRIDEIRLSDSTPNQDTIFGDDETIVASVAQRNINLNQAENGQSAGELFPESRSTGLATDPALADVYFKTTQCDEEKLSRSSMPSLSTEPDGHEKNLSITIPDVYI